MLKNQYAHAILTGLVPAMKFTVPGIMDEEIIYESAVVSQFLCDSFPSHLLPATREDPTASLKRARINFFTDTWNSKLSSYQMSILKASAEEKEEKVDECVAVAQKEIEPLLADAKPFFGGSKELTFAECIVAPFLIRLYAFAEDDEYMPVSLAKKLDGLSNFGPWAKAVRQHPSVTKIWDEKDSLEGFKRKYGKMFSKTK